MTNNAQRHFKRADGITAITPAYPERFKSAQSIDNFDDNLGNHIPFTTDTNTHKFCIRDATTITNPEDNTMVEGILAYEITPLSWTLVYVPTEKLYGHIQGIDDNRNRINEFDFYETPIERIHSGFQQHVLDIMQGCVDYMNRHPSLSANVVDSIENTIRKLNQSKTTNFTIDVYIPPRICDLMGERYFRPGGEYYSAFDNPARHDIDFTPPRALIEFLHKKTTQHIPANGLRLSCDDYFEVENRMLEQEAQRELVAQKLDELQLSGKFKIAQGPIRNREISRPEIPPLPGYLRPVARPFIIPAHWHYD